MIVAMDTISLILAGLATARVTRLVTGDRLTERPRLWLLTQIVRRNRHGDESLAAYLVTCPWCVSVYAGAGFGAGWWLWGESRWFTAAVAALAFSYATGWLASRESED